MREEDHLGGIGRRFGSRGGGGGIVPLNRKGFTAIMDAVFFVVLISLAVSVISQSQTSQNEISETADVCDSVLATQVYLRDLDYPDGDRLMKLTDIWALSMLAEDGKVTGLVKGCFDAVFPWEDSYGFTVEYQGLKESAGCTTDGWNDSVQREYDVEFGGTLKVTVFRYV